MGCLFCGLSEKAYWPDAGKEYICSKFVQLLLSADQEDLYQAHKKAILKGYTNKARAIETFLIAEELNVRETQKSKRRTIGKMPMRLVRPTFDQLRT